MQASTTSETLIDHLHAHGYSRRFVRTILGLRVFYVDLSNLRLRLSAIAPFIELSKGLLDSETPIRIFQTVRDVMLQTGMDIQIPIILLEARSEDFRQLFADSSYKGKVVLLGEGDMKTILDSSCPSDTLLAFVRFQVPLMILSPYEVTAPVTGSQFFGRETEIRRMINHPEPNYLVIGSRRLGKTSILKEVQRRMLIQDRGIDGELTPILEQKYCYFDCLAYNNSNEFFADVMTTLDPREYNRLDRTNLSSYFPIFLRKMHKRVGGRVVFFMDEIDQLIKFDRQWGYEVTRALMAGSSNGYCRLIWAGFREAKEEMSRLESPASAKFTPIDLPSLSMDDTRDLVEIPMQNLGVKMRNREDIVKRIQRDSGGHPNFVQHICQTLVKHLDQDNNREITPASLERLPDDEAFRGRVMDVFIADTNDFEKVVAYAVAELHQFSVEDADQRLNKLDIKCEIRETEQALSLLAYLGVIQQRGLVYHFTVPILPRLIIERYRDRFIRDKAIEFREKQLARKA